VGWTPAGLLAAAAAGLLRGLPRSAWAADVLAEQAHKALRGVDGPAARAAARLVRPGGAADRAAVRAAVDAMVLAGLAVPTGLGRTASLAVPSDGAPAAALPLTLAEHHALARASQRAEAIFVAWSNTAAAAADRRAGTTVSGTTRRHTVR
jgi:hypothetical protein